MRHARAHEATGRVEPQIGLRAGPFASGAHMCSLAQLVERARSVHPFKPVRRRSSVPNFVPPQCTAVIDTPGTRRQLLQVPPSPPPLISHNGVHGHRRTPSRSALHYDLGSLNRAVRLVHRLTTAATDAYTPATRYLSSTFPSISLVYGSRHEQECHLVRAGKMIGQSQRLISVVSVLGALLGTQTGRDVEIVNTFELAMAEDGAVVDQDFLITRKDQCTSRISLLPYALLNTV